MKNRNGKNQSFQIEHTQADITLKDGTRPHIMLAIDEMTRCILGYAVARNADAKSMAKFRKSILRKSAHSLPPITSRHQRRLPRK